MNEGGKLAPLREEDYALIESAVMETARGRWFLSEYARRNRTADTRILLDAIKRLERVVSAQSVEFLPNLSGAEAPRALRALMREAARDVLALFSAGSDPQRTAALSPARALENRLYEQSAVLDELIMTLRAVHDGLAVADDPSEARGRLAHALDRLAALSRSHQLTVQAIRRGITLFQTLETALGTVNEDREPEPPSSPLPKPLQKSTEQKSDVKAASEMPGRIVVIRTPGSGSAPEAEEVSGFIPVGR